MRVLASVAALLCQWVAAYPFSASSLVALRISNGGSALGLTTGNAIYVDEFNASGSKLQTLATPSTCTLDASAQALYVYEGRLTSSSDSQLVSYACFNAGIGAPVLSASRRVISVGVDGAFSSSIITGLSGGAAFAAVKASNDAASVFYHGGSVGLYYTPAAGGSSMVLSTYDATSIVIWANSLCAFARKGGRETTVNVTPSLAHAQTSLRLASVSVCTSSAAQVHSLMLPPNPSRSSHRARMTRTAGLPGELPRCEPFSLRTH